MKLSDYVIQFLAGKGVRHIFLLPGGGAMHLNDSLARSPSILPVANLHEQGCAIAAEAYARVSGQLGVVMVTCGPGGTNTVTGLAGAWLDSTPVLFLSGQVKRSDLKAESGLRQSGVQEIDIVSIVRTLTKYSVTVLEPASMRFHLEKAWHLATTGRQGPVWLDIPLDVQAAEIDPEAQEAFVYDEPAPGVNASELSALVRRAIGILQGAQRPVVLLGNGIRLAGAVPVMERWLQQVRAPVLTTWLGLDLVPHSDPLLVGRPGGIAPRAANFAVQNCDCLIAIGARLDPIVTGYAHGKFARAAQKIVVDLDPRELEKFSFVVDCPIAADARIFLAEWELQSAAQSYPDWQPWLARCQGWKKRYPLLLPEHLPNQVQPLSLYHFAKALSDALPEGQLVASGSSGFACEIFLLMLEVKRGQRIFHNRGTGSMGFAVPAALGAAIASGKSVVSLEGDGGFQMNLQELAVIAGRHLPITFFVINNSGYASIRSSQDNYFQGRHIASDRQSGLFLPQVRLLAEAYGIAYRCIDAGSNLKEEIGEVLDFAAPIICEVFVRQDEARTPRLASTVRADGSIVSRPLEDLYPFLSREEFLENMIVPPLEESTANV
jgi:acetolactate synthase-1/2/3 large subunit